MEYENCKENEATLDKLDIEYRQILRIIKPYIQTINNNNYLAQYRVWLEKLSAAKETEKTLRNRYLLELARQIQCKNLASPFTQNPPPGALLPLRMLQQQVLEAENPSYDQTLDITDPYCMNKQNMCLQWTEENRFNQWPFHPSTLARPQRPIISGQQNDIDEDEEQREAERCVERTATVLRKMNLMREIDGQTKKFMEARANSNPNSPTRSPSRPLRTSNLPTMANPSLGVIHEDTADFEEDDFVSWDEMSDGASNPSVSVLGSGDTEHRSPDTKLCQLQQLQKQEINGDNFADKINTLMVEMNDLKKKGEKVNVRFENTLKTVQGQLPRELQPSEANKKDTDLEQKNEHDKEASFLTTDWKKIIESLQVRLSETQQQNRELNALTSTLHKRVKEIDVSKEQVKQDIKKQLLEQHKKEIDLLKNDHSSETQEIIKVHQAKIKEVEETFERQREEWEVEHKKLMKELEETHSAQLKEKEAEIHRLEEVIQKECSRLINEISVLRGQIQETSQNNATNDERILFLQKCITKMDRLFQKSEREYCKQIEKLKQEMENREKAMQIQLQTQKADIISRCSAEKQTEMDIIVQNLEAKYSRHLEMQQKQIELVKNQDEKTIRELREILDQHDIPY